METESLKDKTAIVGIGHTEYSKDSGRSEMSLAVEAIRNAIADAGLKPSDIDGIAKFSMDNNDPVDIAANLGIPALRFYAEAPYGGGGGPVGSILLGAMAVATGMANYVVAFRAMNERSGQGDAAFRAGRSPQGRGRRGGLPRTLRALQPGPDGGPGRAPAYALIRDQERRLRCHLGRLSDARPDQPQRGYARPAHHH